MKAGILRNLRDKNRGDKSWLDRENFVEDTELRSRVEQVFAKEYRIWAYEKLILAKKHPLAKKAYFNLNNSFEKEGDSGNICCMAVDLAHDILKKSRSENKKKKRKNA